MGQAASAFQRLRSSLPRAVGLGRESEDREGDREGSSPGRAPIHRARACFASGIRGLASGVETTPSQPPKPRPSLPGYELGTAAVGLPWNPVAAPDEHSFPEREGVLDFSIPRTREDGKEICTLRPSGVSLRQGPFPDGRVRTPPSARKLRRLGVPRRRDRIRDGPAASYDRRFGSDVPEAA